MTAWNKKKKMEKSLFLVGVDSWIIFPNLHNIETIPQY